MTHQLQFIDRFLQIYGFKGIDDYTTKISTFQFKENKIFLELVNNEIPQIKKLFKMKDFNLSRKNYIVDSAQLAVSTLKKCLQQANVPFEYVHTNKKSFMRLKPFNIVLVDYIRNRMSNLTNSSNILNSDNKETLLKIDDFEKDVLDIYEKLELHPDAKLNNVSGISAGLVTLINNPGKIITSTYTHTYDLVNDIPMYSEKEIIFSVPIKRSEDGIYQFSYKLYNNKSCLLYNDNITNISLVTDDIVIYDNIDKTSYKMMLPMCSIPYDQFFVKITLVPGKYENLSIDLTHKTALFDTPLRKSLQKQEFFIYNKTFKIHDGKIHKVLTDI